MDNPIVEAGDGIEALQHLRGEGGHSKLQPPFMVLLDLNMPRMGGIEFLEQVRGDPALESALIFVMTTSLAENDRAGAYAQHVAGYILKQRPGQSFLDAIRMLSQYCKVVEFPVCT
jgi:CheY-like chemotaxis protein